MLTWRYHLLSLAAIFLALAFGVLVGISLSDSGAVNTGQSGLVNDIQRDVANLQDQNNLLSQERATSLRFEDDSFPFIVGSRLQGERIAVVSASVAGDELERKLEEAIHGAGGQIVSTTMLNSRYSVPATLDRVHADLKADPAFASADESSIQSLLGRQLAQDISRGGGTRVLGSLQGVLVDSASGRYDTPVDAVVVVSQADDDQTPAYSDLEKSFILRLKELGVLVVGCEASDAPRSEVPLFQSLDISSVDNLESRIGQVSLVYVLGGEKGAFGIKPTADMLIPILRTKTPATQTAQGAAATTAQPAAAAPAAPGN